MAAYDDIDYTVFGFQNFVKNAEHVQARDIPSHVYVYDAFAGENPKQMGFGFDQVKSFVTMNRPDVCVVYNDMVVVSNILNQLKEAQKDISFKIIVYIDQVYLYQRKEFIDKLNSDVDYVLCFTEYWQNVLRDCGVTKPMGYLQHGFDKMVNYPVPKKLARKHFGLKENDFIILNLNRNQPRKRWDICLQAFAEVVSRHVDEPIKLLIATTLTGAWNLMEVYERELKKRGLTLEEGKKHLILIDNPQQLTDEDVNILYNVADIGINTCDGEGFGLCNFQQAGIGIPQIVPNIGGFRDFFNQERAILVQPKYNLYIESSRDGVGGESEICEWNDFADAIDELYSNPEQANAMGAAARDYIINNYKWDTITKKFYTIVKDVVAPPPSPAPIVEKKDETNETNIDINKLNEQFNNVNIVDIKHIDYADAAPQAEAKAEPVAEPVAEAKVADPSETPAVTKDTISGDIKIDTIIKREDLLDLKNKIEALLKALPQ
jgi:glycosyltransferase involved in cell wall biosynthesis